MRLNIHRRPDHRERLRPKAYEERTTIASLVGQFIDDGRQRIDPQQELPLPTGGGGSRREWAWSASVFSNSGVLSPRAGRSDHTPHLRRAHSFHSRSERPQARMPTATRSRVRDWLTGMLDVCTRKVSESP